MPVILGLALHGPWVVDLSGQHPVSAFGASHVWGLDHLVRQWSEGLFFSVETDRLGFPRGGPAPTLGWGPALLSLPFRLVAGPLGAYAAALFVSLALAGMAAQRWFVRLGASPWAATAGAVVFATSTGVLNNIALGNIDKLSLWVYPAWLALGAAVISDRRGWAWLPLLALVSFLAPMSEPYLGLFLPLVCVPALVLAAFRLPRSDWPRAALLGVLTVGLTALCMLPARSYFAQYKGGAVGAAVFRPASVHTADGGDGWTRPWAGLDDLLRTSLPVPEDHERAFHIFYVGAVGLLAGVVLSSLPGVKRRVDGWLVLLLSLVLVLGPYTVIPPAWGWTGHPQYLMPVHLLERIGYPTSAGGQYYRALPLVALGYAALLAVGLSALRPRLSIPIGALVALLAMVDAVGASPDAWPRPLRPVPCRPVLAAIAAAEGPGAVLNINLRASQSRNGEALMLATLHGRPVNTLPLQTMGAPVDAAYGFLSPLGEAGSTESAVAWARAQGFRFLLDAPLGSPSLDLLKPERLEATLGAPTWTDEDCAAWDLGPLPTISPPAPGRPGPAR